MNWIMRIGITFFSVIGIFLVLGIIYKYIVRYKNTKKINRQKTPYINQPLKNKDNDQIGVSIYVEKIKQSIKEGAEVIAIASDFGTGKSSLISLLEKEYGIFKRFRYKFSTINLWGFVKSEDDAIEIHKNFIYQLVSRLNTKRGSHLSKKLSKNYGVLKLGVGSPVILGMTFVAIISLTFAEIIRRYVDNVMEYVEIYLTDVTKQDMFNISIFLYFLFGIIVFIIITNTDIVFSSAKSEGNREIDENIVMDYYKMQVINKGIMKHYVIVIEDLDRISNPQVVFDFLIELHKYYIPEYDNRFWKWIKNKVTFIVCIKPAAQLQNELNSWLKKERDSDDKLTNNESDITNNRNIKSKKDPDIVNMQEIYSKIFDLIIELRRINIDNYDSILHGLLEEKKEYLLDKKIIEVGENVADIEGIQWIIRGEELSIREIKQRLNDAFILYEVLVEKFGELKIEFSKCIIVSYLTNAFSMDMLEIKDDAFELCINSYLKEENDYSAILKESSEEFVKTVAMLIEGKQIQADYRVYFYNYPKNSYLYDIYDAKIINALLYDLTPEEDFTVLLEYIKSESILYAITKIHGLKIPLPKIALKYEKILNVVLEKYPNMVTDYIKGELNYSENEIVKTTTEVRNIMSLLLKNLHISKQVVEDVITIWNEDISKTSLLEIRNMLCKDYREYILLFKDLFQNDNPLITIKEIKLIDDNIESVLKLINYSAVGFDDMYFKEISEILSKTSLHNRNVQEFYIKSYSIVTMEVVANRIIKLTQKENVIPDEIDKLLASYYWDGAITGQQYVDLLTEKGIAGNSINNLHEMQWSEGLSINLCKLLYEQKYYVDYIVNVAKEHIEVVDLLDENIRKCVQENADEIYERNLESFMNIRKAVLKLKLTKQYEYLYMKPYEGITSEELNIMDDTYKEIEIMSKNEPSATMDEIINHFNKKYQDSKKSANIIDYIYDKCTPQEFEKYFYKLNMDNIRFRKLSQDNKLRFIGYIKKIGMLNTTVENLKFMKFIKELLPELEKNISSEIIGVLEYETKYVDIINLVDSITEQTINNIKQFKYLHVYDEKVNDILLNKKFYNKYLYSVTIKNQAFSMPTANTLLDAAEIIFKEKDWKTIINLMCKNEKFMGEMIARQVYKAGATIRGRFVVSPQTKDMVESLFIDCSDEEIISYLCKISGFKDYEAAKEFVLQIIHRPKVLLSQEIYNHTHHMLVDKTLKQKYTKARNMLTKK